MSLEHDEGLIFLLAVCDGWFGRQIDPCLAAVERNVRFDLPVLFAVFAVYSGCVWVNVIGTVAPDRPGRRLVSEG